MNNQQKHRSVGFAHKRIVTKSADKRHVPFVNLLDRFMVRNGDVMQLHATKGWRKMA